MPSPNLFLSIGIYAVGALSSFAGKVRSDICGYTVAYWMAQSAKGDCRRLWLTKVSILGAIPLFIVLLSIFGPFLTDSVYVYSGVAVDVGARIVPGNSNIDPNVGSTAFALGARAAHSILSGHLPLWNPYEGLGTPLLGEMQSAAMFPLTLLLAISHGQAIELALLQFVAGVGAFLFFKRFGLGTTASLAGSLVFELNGVFAWLRDATCNPVAFLPWLFFTVESLRIAALEKLTWLERAPAVCLGSVMATLALYAGFPEVVYLYSLLLFAWVGFRMVGLSGRQNVTFVSDLLLTSLIALLFSAPLLVSFVDFLSVSELGLHDPGFYGIWLNPGALIQYITPYVFGPIFTFATDNQAVLAIWSNTGGYIGFVPIVFALAGILLSDQRPVKIFLLGWVIIAVGVTHGLPGIYQAFMILPLVKEAASFRYLNISWIFCIIFLSSLFIDSVLTLPRITLRKILRWALVGGLILITVAGGRAWSTLSALWAGRHYEWTFIIGALLSVAVLSSLIIAVAHYSTTINMARLMAGIMVVEAAAWFLLPYLSYPRHGQIDDDAVSFLQANIGYQRVIDAGGSRLGLSPNYGSYFRIPLVNYDDLPAPKLTSQYIKANLDPYADAISFLPDWGNLSSEQQADRQKIFLERLSRYAQAGVKYVLAGASFDKALQQGSVLDAKLVHRSRSMNIYQLSDTRNYFSAPSCALKSLSRDRINASCAQPSKLTRLELFMRGWSATVNGYSVPIGRSDGVFQTIDLPAGEAQVEFAFYPPGFKPALALAGVTLLLVLAILASALRDMRMRRSWSSGRGRSTQWVKILWGG